MKKVFRTHLLLVIEGRLLTSLFAAFGPSMTLLSIWLAIEVDMGVSILIFIISICFCLLSAFVLPHFWEQCWGKLIITDTYVMWRCLFCKPIKISYDELRYVKLTSFQEGNVYRNRDYYKTGYLYLLLSSEPLPKLRIDKIRSKNKLIKFPLYDKKLGNVLYTTLPNPYNRYFGYFKEV